MSEPAVPRDPVADLRRIAFLLERTLESSYRVKAFRTAAAALAALPVDDVALLATTGGLRGIKGIGDRTALVVEQSVGGDEPDYLRDLEATAAGPLADLSGGGEELRAALRGDLHPHSDWSDGGVADRGDGPDGGRARARVRGAHRPLAAADGRQRADRRAAARAARRRRATLNDGARAASAC